MKQGMDMSEGLSSKPVGIPVLARKAGKKVTGAARGSSLSLVHPVHRAENLLPSLQVMGHGLPTLVS